MLSRDLILPPVATALAVGSYALYGTFAPTSSFWGKVIWRAAPSAGPRVSLTFDDGPTEGCTDRILDLLAKHQVRAAFFVIGRNVERSPELVRRMDADGHLVATHSYDHGHYDMFRWAGYWNRQMSQSIDLITEIIGKRPALFRPPMGFTTPLIHHAARRAKQTVVTWSKRARDGRTGATPHLSQRLLRRVRSGDILMLHDGIDPHLRATDSRSRDATIAALPTVIEGLKNRALQIVRLDELLSIPAYTDAPAASAAASGLPAPSVARAIQ